MTNPPRDNDAYRFPVSVKGVVIRAGEVILLRNERDEWELPGGKLELSESPEQCLAREIAEELRLEIVPESVLSSWVYTIVPGVHVLVLTYGCSESSRDEAVLSDEHKELRWFPLADIDALRMPEGYKASIRAWSTRVPNVATRKNSTVEQAVPFFWVRDLQESLRFYVDGLGFTRTKQWINEGRLRWCWLELGDTAVMLQEFWREGQHRNVPDGNVGVGVSINFTCEDALAIYKDLRSRGVEAKRPFVGNAMWVTEVADPDGYRLFFESPTDAAEETVFSE